MSTGNSNWARLQAGFETLAKEGDANALWVFDASHGYQNTWSLSDAPNARLHRALWERIAEAGGSLPTRGSPYSMFPTRLLAEPSPAWRWCAALRHAGINVVHFGQNGLRSESGMLSNVASASGILCRRLAEAKPRRPMRARKRRTGALSDRVRATDRRSSNVDLALTNPPTQGASGEYVRGPEA
jgi:hypothetical protein